MTDSLISDSAERLFARFAAAPYAAGPLWQAVEEAGFPLALLSEAEGGFGLAPAEAFAPLRIAARRGLGLPLAETMLANWCLAKAGRAPREGQGAFVPSLGRPVPWGRGLDWVLIAEGDQLHLATGAVCRWDEGLSISAEPLDRLRVLHETAEVLPLPLSAGHLEAMMAILRAVQIAGALEGTLAMSLAYAATRVQFGRSLSKFQVIQQYLSVMAAQTSAAGAAAQMGAEAFAAWDTAPERLIPLAAAAKIRTGEAAGVAAEVAHQIHGAIGFSQEYPLHSLTRRLWTWRDLDGSEAEWSRRLAAHLAQMPGQGLWPKITQLQMGAF